MRFLLLFILLFEFIIADEVINIQSDINKTIDSNTTEINTTNDIEIISLPNEVNEENLSFINIESDNYDEKLKIAILINKKQFFKYLPSLINSIDAYLLYKNINFEVKVFNLDSNISLDEIAQKYQNIFLYSLDLNIISKLQNYPDNNFYLPIINKNQLKEQNISKNIYFGGLDFYKQVNKLNSFVTDKSYIIKENNMLSNLTTNIEKNIIFPQKVLSYPINYRITKRYLNNSYVFLNTKVVHTAQILSNFTYYGIKPKLVLSTQINYNPLLFSLTNLEDVKKFIVANSLLLPNIELLDNNMNLGSDLKFNWLNYTTSALLNKVYIDDMYEYPYFLNDFNLYIFDNQVEYKTKLYKVFENGFIEIK